MGTTIYSQLVPSTGNNLDLQLAFKAKDGLLEPPVCSLLVRSSGDSLGLLLASEGGGQSSGTEPLSRGIWRCVRVDSVRIESPC